MLSRYLKDCILTQASPLWTIFYHSDRVCTEFLKSKEIVSDDPLFGSIDEEVGEISGQNLHWLRRLKATMIMGKYFFDIFVLLYLLLMIF